MAPEKVGAVSDDGVTRIGVMLEQLGGRFELVIEAVSGFGGRLEALRDEMRSQFSEVGKQIRFLCDQLAENRDGLNSVRTELTAELVRLGEALGATRVEARQDLSAVREQMTSGQQQLKQGFDATVDRLRAELSTPAKGAMQIVKDASTAARRELAASLEAIGAQLRADLKQTHKALSALSKKLERFDDRVTVEVRDHGQRIRKLEARQRS